MELQSADQREPLKSDGEAEEEDHGLLKKRLSLESGPRKFSSVKNVVPKV